MIRDRVMDMVANELSRSIELHGDWHDYTLDQMMAVVCHEFMFEAGNAAETGDIYGEHGVINEMIQTAATSIKTVMVLLSRPNETLAETVRTEGAHSEGEGCSLPSSPSLCQDKESMANHPKGVRYGN